MNFQLKENLFVIVLNSENPDSEDCLKLRDELEEKYNTAVVPLSCKDLSLDNINNIFLKFYLNFQLSKLILNFQDG